MSYFQGNDVILHKENLAKNIYRLVIAAPDIAAFAKAGQFVHVTVPGYFLRRPISLCEADSSRGTITLVYEIRGEGTKALARLNEGETLDVMGPLGHGFTLDPGKKVIIVGGGIGVPPLLQAVKFYGANAKAILGFRDASAVILEEDFRRYGAETIVCTDNGTRGQKGFVTDALAGMVTKEKPDYLFACGPKVMLEKVAKIAADQKIECEVSLEERMGCGVGACLVCACRLKRTEEEKEYYGHVCKDGPVFPAKEVVF